MRPAALLAFVAAGLVAGAALPAAAQSIWKWRDANGGIQISDRPPPPEVPQKNILQRPAGTPGPKFEAAVSASAASTGGAAASAAAGDDDLQKKRRKTEQDKAAQAKAEKDAAAAKLAQTKAHNCEIAREQVRTYESGMRITRINAQGEKEYIDDATRAAALQSARSAQSTYCN